MTQNIKKELLFTGNDGGAAYKFKIPNKTGDYVEVTNYGASLLGMYVHKPDLSMENLLAGAYGYDAASNNEARSLLGGELSASLSKKVWNVVEEGDNYVFFAASLSQDETTCNTRIKAGLRIMWVNLNRLVLDMFITPEKDAAISLESSLGIQSSGKEFCVRTFSPDFKSGEKEYLPVSQTPYKNMAFVPLGEATPVFINTNEDIKPVLELSDSQSFLRLSVYSTLSAAQCQKSPQQGPVLISSFSDKAEGLKGGQTLSHRIIYGVDYIKPQAEDDLTDPTPFGFMF